MLANFGGPGLGFAQSGVTVRLTQVDDHSYTVQGAFAVQKPRSHVWQVLTDYDHIARFVSSMQSSRVQSRQGSNLVVLQTVKKNFLVFSKSYLLVLRVREKSPQRIDFTETSHKDLKAYGGYWSLTPTAQGTRVQYVLRIKTKPTIFQLPTASTIKSTSVSLLREVQAEINRRPVR